MYTDSFMETKVICAYFQHNWFYMREGEKNNNNKQDKTHRHSSSLIFMDNSSCNHFNKCKWKYAFFIENRDSQLLKATTNMHKTKLKLQILQVFFLSSSFPLFWFRSRLFCRKIFCSHKAVVIFLASTFTVWFEKEKDKKVYLKKYKSYQCRHILIF